MTGAAAAEARAVLAGSLVHNRTRAALAVLAIALGVALGYAIQLITRSAVNELAQSVQTLSGQADLQLRGARSGFDEGLYATVARLPEVAAASPIIEVDARLAGRDDTLAIVGIDALRAAAVEPALVADAGDRLDLLRSDTLFLSPSAAQWLASERGAALSFQRGLGEVRLRVAGELSASSRRRFAVMDIAGAQSAFDRRGVLTRIDLRLEPGVDVAAFRERLQRSLPAGVAVDRPEANLAAGASVSRSYRVNLNVLALVALFTGGLLVFSTQALAIVRRRTQLALLRVLGMRRRRLLAWLVAEGAAIGAVGSALGLPAGYFLAAAAVRVIGPDLGSGYFRGVAPELEVAPPALMLCFALGVAAALLGSLVPAIEAARAAPAQALKPGDEERAFSRLRPIWPGIAAIAAGGAVALLPPIAELPLFGYLAIALLLAGTLLLMPVMSAWTFAAAPAPLAPAPRLALLQLRGAPGQAAVSLAAIVASMSLMISMAIMVVSFRDALDAWLEHVLPADLYVRASAGGDTGYLSQGDQARIAALPGVRRAEFLREQQLLLEPSRPRIFLLARSLDESAPQERLPLVTAPQTLPAGAAPPIWANEAMADLYGFTPGKTVTLPIAEKPREFTVAGIWRDYARPQGAVVIERGRYIALTGDRSASGAALWLAPGAKIDDISRALVRSLPGGEQLDIAGPGEIREFSLRIFDRTFAVTYALELAAVAIGLLGLSSSFGALVLARRREFGVLRHLGMTRRQIGAMLATEGLAVSGLGLAIGLALGFAISLVLVHVVNRQSFHWGMTISVPWIALAATAAAVLALATATAWLSGRRTMSEGVVRAVKEDW
ncbi:MAG TPA: FtsX-like permease family protein [Casimicrobiaceae bacterium]|nr:FtsX-like permease family protein [Casimicrobiaceae bacterium]